MSTEAGLHRGGYSVPGDEGKWSIGAASGQPHNLLQPDPASIILSDVARGLSMTCRFAGQVDRFYSVAEHSALVYDLLSNEYPDAPLNLRSWALLHDASEAFLHDVTGPLKHAMGVLREDDERALQMQLPPDPYSEIEARWMEAVRIRFSLQAPDPLEVQAVKRFDHRAACLEGGRIKVHEPFFSQYRDVPLPAGVSCEFGLSPTDAEAAFLECCAELGIR